MVDRSPQATPRVRPRGGPIRLAVGAGVLLCLLRWSFQAAPLAYLAALAAMAFGLLLTLVPSLLSGRGFWRVAADALALAVLLAATGGAESPFSPLFFLAALSVPGLAGRADRTGRVRGGGSRTPPVATAAAAALVGGYSLAAASVGGFGALGSAPFVLNAAALAAFCAGAVHLGREARGVDDRAQEAAAAAARERAHREGADGLSHALAPALGALDVGSALGIVAEAARGLVGGSYSHVAALGGGPHRTVMEGAPDACPGWWHPVVQRLLLWSCREGKTVRDEETVHGVEGFVAVPVFGPSDGESWGSIIVGGGGVGAEEERALRRLAGAVAPALARRPDAEGGLDLASGLPNAASLFRVLRAALSGGGVPGGAPGVLAVDLGAGEIGRAGNPADEDLLRRLGRRLESAGQRAFRYGENVLVVLVADKGEAAAPGQARALGRMLREEADVPEGGAAGPAIGYARGEARGPEELLGAALRDMGRARAGEEGVGAPATVPGAGTPSVRGLVEAIAARDPYLSRHSLAVSRVAGRLGRVLRLSGEQVSLLEVGALLHDVGKIGIPDSILHKADVLTGGEYAVVKRHPALGARILDPFPELAPVVAAVRHHHERFDGLGYPDGLRGEGIPLLARVVCVADAFDSMTRERPYEGPITAEAALREIQRNAGTQFDPRIVDALSRAAFGPDDPLAGFAC